LYPFGAESGRFAVRKRFEVRGTFSFDLDAGQEGGNKEFWYQRMFDGENGSCISNSRFGGAQHVEPDGTRGPIKFDTDGTGIVGKIIRSKTNFGGWVVWRVASVGPAGQANYPLRIELLGRNN